MEDHLDPTCVKSRTGYVIIVSNCPIVWKSTLQTNIATSTSEAEYTALSTAMRELLPIKSLFERLQSALGSEKKTVSIKTSVWEDNDACRIIANWEPGRNTSRTKHFAIKYHWFRSHIYPHDKSSTITVKRIETNLQRADMLTKGLPRPKFEALRKLLCG